MGFGANKLRRAVTVAPTFTPLERSAIQRVNLEDNLRDTLPEMERAQAIAKAEALADEHMGDIKQYTTWPFTPLGISKQALLETGTQRAARAAMQRMMQQAMDNGEFVDLRGGITGNAPSYQHKGLFSTATRPEPAEPAMGHAWDVAMTRTTPRKMLDQMTGDPSQSDRIVARIAARNSDAGDLLRTPNRPTVYQLGDYEKQLNRPWYVFRSMNDGFDTSERYGFADPFSRSIVVNRSADPHLLGPFEDMPGFREAGGINVAQHEAIHGIKDHRIPSRSYLAWALTRPAVSETKGLTGMPLSFARNGDEISNLIFHTKRLAEITQPGMRDTGGNLEDAREFINWVRKYQKTGADPSINLEGHPNFGSPAHGLERQIEILQEILNHTTPAGEVDMTNMTHDLGQTTPSLKAALLA